VVQKRCQIGYLKKKIMASLLNELGGTSSQ